MTFRKRPVVIEAIRTRDVITFATRDWKMLPQWLRDAYEAGDVIFAAGGVSIRTREGTMLAQPTDWIIRGVAGELYPCKPEIFDVTYDPEPLPEHTSAA